VRNFICSHFDSCGGGIIGSGTSSLSSKEIVFRCYRFRVSKGNTQDNRKEAKDSKKAITKTSRPRTSDESCSWRFTLYFEASEDDQSAGRWYLYEDGIGNRFHNGRIQKKEHEISRRVALLDKDELEITDDGLDVNLSSQSMATMFMQRTKLVVDPKKLRNHHTKSQKKHSCSLAGMTAAEQVIHKLSTNDQVSVAWLVADVSIGHKLVTTYTGNRRATSTKVPELNITFQSNIASNGNEPVALILSSADIMEMTQSAPGADGDTPVTAATEIYNSLGINDDAQILLSIAWTTNKQRRFLGMFPESASSDVIMKTNNEKRPSFHICSKTSSNETFSGFSSFLASQSTWMFDFTWSMMVPALSDPRFEKRNELMTTDNDSKLHGPFTAQTTAIGRYKNSKHQDCTFHLFTQGFTKNKITSSRVKDGPNSYIGKALLDAIKSWMISWTNDVESPAELSLLRDLLLELIADKETWRHFDSSFPDDFLKFLIDKIWRRRGTFAHYEFMDRRSFGTRTSNDSEVEGGILKHHAAGPKPNHSMAKSADSATKVTDMRITLKKQRAAKAMYAVPIALDPELVPLYDNVTQYCGNNVAANWKNRIHFTVFRASLHKFYVKLASFRTYDSDPSDIKEFLKYMIPKFERTRVVEVFDHHGKLRIKCSCRCRRQHGYDCAEIFAVFGDAAPSPDDVVIRWHKVYHTMYLSGNPEVDEVFDELVENESPGALVPCRAVEEFRPDLPIGKSTTSHTREYFESTLPTKPPKLHQGVKWANAGSHARGGTHAGASDYPCGASFQAFVALLQTARDNNAAYAARSQPEAATDSLSDVECGCAEMDTSMATYASKSPERPQQSQQIDEMKYSLARMSTFTVLRPKFESLCAAIHNDPELTLKTQQALGALYSEAMKKQRGKSNANKSRSSGMQSLPATDRATKSKRLESAPTGNNAAGKKRSARKPPN
jgi:hypothetical protein